ncbi:Clp protease N-terminal domain-containing protein [Micromonospora rhizosphaerae]|uniref:Clp protease N-terminal domain-containing protein n=1 Tax=Micromonospora rhizosphaerae TaxID=568872 RepID=UPI00159F15EB|nr:Clp protease N-terminal domain-containing protein [Micromonospora rhizosphaerae]
MSSGQGDPIESDPFEGAEVAAGLDRAREISLAYRHRDTGTSHLLLSLVEDDAGEAAAILRALGVDPAAVRERVQQDLASAPAVLPPPTAE